MGKGNLAVLQNIGIDSVTAVHPARYFALACDYDGTIAHSGVVSDTTVQALRKLKASGRKLILVTGRLLPDLQAVFPEFGVFHRIVAENGALLYRPESNETKLLAAQPPAAFIESLRKANVTPLDVGAGIVSTWVPSDAVVLKIIRDMGLELNVVYNKGAVMILPSGVNKATGLAAALSELGISPHNTVAVGDAENDHALLASCAVGVALQNAIATLKDEADVTTEETNGRGVESLIARMLANDLGEISDRRGFSKICLGTAPEEREVRVNSFSSSLLIAGPSASGKSTIVHSLLENMLDSGYQVCLVDPEGDYEQAQNVLCLGTSARSPELPEISKALESPSTSVAVNLLGLGLDERPRFFNALLGRLQEMRTKFGRPHWIIFDEAHHLMPSSWQQNPEFPELKGVVLVTVHPEAVSSAALKSVNGVIAVGEAPENTLEQFRTATGLRAFADIPQRDPGTVVAWFPYESPNPVSLRVHPPKHELRRHKRKYATGELGDDKSFYFRGPEGKLNLQAQNLALFIQIARGVDNATWMHHLKQHDYSRWLTESIKDEGLSCDVFNIENAALDPEESRKQIFKAIETHYTADEKNSLP